MPFKQIIYPKSRDAGVKSYVTGEDYAQQQWDVRDAEFDNTAMLRSLELKKPYDPRTGDMGRMNYLSQSLRTDRVNRITDRVNPWRKAKRSGPTVHPDITITADGGVSGPLFTVEGTSYGGEKSLFWIYGYRQIISVRMTGPTQGGHVLRFKSSRAHPKFKDVSHMLYSYETTSNSTKKKENLIIRFYDHKSDKVLSETLEVAHRPAVSGCFYDSSIYECFPGPQLCSTEVGRWHVDGFMEQGTDGISHQDIDSDCPSLPININRGVNRLKITHALCNINFTVTAGDPEPGFSNDSLLYFEDVLLYGKDTTADMFRIKYTSSILSASDAYGSWAYILVKEQGLTLNFVIELESNTAFPTDTANNKYIDFRSADGVDTTIDLINDYPALGWTGTARLYGPYIACEVGDSNKITVGIEFIDLYHS